MFESPAQNRSSTRIEWRSKPHLVSFRVSVSVSVVMKASKIGPQWDSMSTPSLLFKGGFIELELNIKCVHQNKFSLVPLLLIYHSGSRMVSRIDHWREWIDLYPQFVALSVDWHCTTILSCSVTSNFLLWILSNRLWALNIWNIPNETWIWNAVPDPLMYTQNHFFIATSFTVITVSNKANSIIFVFIFGSSTKIHEGLIVYFLHSNFVIII